MSYGRNLSEEMKIFFDDFPPKRVDSADRVAESCYKDPFDSLFLLPSIDVFHENQNRKFERRVECGDEFTEIRFCERTAETNAERTAAPFVVETPAIPTSNRSAERSARDEQSQNSENDFEAATSESAFSDSLSECESGDLPSHYTMLEDVYLLIRIAEYRSQTPRLIPKDEFIFRAQPFLARSAKSISKRVDRLSALSAGQRARLFAYVKRFPLRAARRKAVFPIDGSAFLVKRVDGKALSRAESERVKRMQFEAIEANAERVAASELNENTENIFEKIRNVNESKLSKKIAALRAQSGDCAFLLKRENAFGELISFFAANCQLSFEETLSVCENERPKNFGELRIRLLKKLTEKIGESQK